MGERQSGESFRARWPAVAMVGLADREAAKGVRETYQYIVGDSAFHFIVDNGSIELRDGRAGDPSVVVTTDEETWADIATGKTAASPATASGALRVEGDRQAAKRLGKIFSRDRMLVHAKARPPAHDGA
jgi:putative sterol carrier protein